ncbi:hypothetical protein BLOT_002894, partial [Blomia tropicalis]
SNHHTIPIDVPICTFGNRQNKLVHVTKSNFQVNFQFRIEFDINNKLGRHTMIKYYHVLVVWDTSLKYFQVLPSNYFQVLPSNVSCSEY